MRGAVTHVCDVGRRYDVYAEVDSGDVVTVERHRDGVHEGNWMTVTAAASDLAAFSLPE